MKFDDNDIQELKDIVKIGIVSSRDTDKRTARVKIQDQGRVTGDLQIVQTSSEWMPGIGQWVLCLFIPGGEGDGFILGGI